MRVKDKVNKNKNVEKAYKYLIDKGIAPHLVAGIIGNLQQESYQHLDSTVENKIGAVGIAQWLGPRRKDLENFAKKKGEDYRDFDLQLDFLYNELTNTGNSWGSKAKEQFFNARTPEEAARLFVEKFERSGEKPGDKGYEKRLQYANNIYKNYLDSDIYKEQVYTAEDVQRMLAEKQQPTTTKKEQTETKEEEETLDPWQEKLQKKIQKRNFMMELINSGYGDLQAVERTPTTFEDGGEYSNCGGEGQPPCPQDTAYYGTPEYEKAYKEGRVQGQNLDEVTITANKKTGENILKDYPYYDDLTAEEREYFNDDSPIGASIRRKAYTKRGLAEDALTIPGQLLQGASDTTQVPQSAMVEGVEYLRGEDYNFKNIIPGSGKQRVPSDAWGYENPEGFMENAINMGMDVIADPENLAGGYGIFKNLSENALKKGLRKAVPKTKNVSIEVLEKQKQSLEAQLKNIPGRMDPKRIPITEKIENIERKQGVLEANEWQKKWYNTPERKEMLDGYEADWNEYVSEGYEELKKEFKGKNPFSMIKERVKNEDYLASLSSLENIDNPYGKGLRGLSGKKLDAGINREQQNLVFKESVKGKDLVKSVAGHEGNHGMSFDTEEGGFLLPKYFQEDMVKIFGKDQKIPKRIKNGKYLVSERNGVKYGYEKKDDYLKRPEEIYARVSQIRQMLNLSPKEEVTTDMAKNIIKKLKDGEVKGVVNRLGELIKNPKKLAEVMNYLYTTTGVVATGAALNSDN